MHPYIRLDIPRNTIASVLMVLSLTPSPVPVFAGELSAVPNGQRPVFRLPDLDGRQRTSDEFAGKVLLVNFWASWCTPCILEMPSIRRLEDAMRGHPFAVVAINVAEVERRVRTMAQRLELDFAVLLDRDSAVFKRWGAKILPTSYVLDRDGTVRFIALGPLEWDDLDIENRMKELAQDPPDAFGANE